ncbi:hypothetical protein CDD82_1204 [Ophiocordyceps australis]|uniref:Uncharacterized protein n=1 Tax=Ophiocordyceps australis TaxID=1399860 RepID=A0A2C5YJ92_9HYPO|nr:hypothetical protein CDD82_1204 [Ophiocordyceps australis]
MKITAVLIAAIAGFAAAAPVDTSSELVERAPPGGSKFSGRVDPSILPASTFGHNPKGAASNANSNIRAQKNASKGDIRESTAGARDFLSRPGLPKGNGKAVDTGSFNPFDA